MSNDQLIAAAADNLALAHDKLLGVYEQGRKGPVPAAEFTALLEAVGKANSAAVELERRARGGEMPATGG